jgi:lysophospholipase L1-like esterase
VTETNPRPARRLPRLALFILPVLALLGAAAQCEEALPPGRSLYIALGDSVSAGIGASDPATGGFVPLVHQELGDSVDLLNLGHSGDTSRALLEHGHIDRAIMEIEKRNGDADGTNDVDLVTFEIGGNDLLALYFGLVLPGTCPDVDALSNGEECSGPLRATLDGFRANLGDALDRLLSADPDLTVLILTYYNPFSHLEDSADLGDLSLEGLPDTTFPEGLNDLVRAAATQRNLHIVDVYPVFNGRTGELISSDAIHPNDDGYRVMADAVLDVWRALQGE